VTKGRRKGKEKGNSYRRSGLPRSQGRRIHIPGGEKEGRRSQEGQEGKRVVRREREDLHLEKKTTGSRVTGIAKDKGGTLGGKEMREGGKKGQEGKFCPRFTKKPT